MFDTMSGQKFILFSSLVNCFNPFWWMMNSFLCFAQGWMLGKCWLSMFADVLFIIISQQRCLVCCFLPLYRTTFQMGLVISSTEARQQPRTIKIFLLANTTNMQIRDSIAWEF